jgi:hypothetical protein
MKKIAFLAFFGLMCQTAEGVLPPFYESVAEIKAILNDPQLGEKMGYPIERIQRNESGYIVVTRDKSIQVDVVYRHNGIGPAKFQLQFHEPTPNQDFVIQPQIVK